MYTGYYLLPLGIIGRDLGSFSTIAATYSSVKIAWSLVDSFYASSYYEGSGIVTRRELSWNYQCCSEPIQWEIAWFYPLEYFASDREFVQPLFTSSVQSCIFGEVSFPELEQVQWRIACLTSKELLFSHMGEEILTANSIVISYGPVAVTTWYILAAEFISADAYFMELHKVQCISVCISPGDVTATSQIWQGHIWVSMVLEFDGVQVILLAAYITVSGFYNIVM